MQIDIQEIITAFWDGVPDNATWEDLNKGMDINFAYKGQNYTVNTRLGNYWSMGIDGYKKWIEQKAVSVVENDNAR